MTGDVLLVARPVAPASPLKDYSGTWAPILLATCAVIALALALLWRGWRSRTRRQAAIPAPAPVPAEVLEREPALAVEGMFVGTVHAADRLDRVAVHGLGLRSAAVLEVHTVGDCPGLLVLRPGMDPLFVPAAHLVDAGRSAGIAGKFVEPGGLVAWGWSLGDAELTSAFRPRRGEDRDRVLAALQTVIDRVASAVRAGEENRS
ncbi:hypothetical protein [Micrococcus sp.]|uniref:PH-like domain-containing protein n=1 Tax=Micrococcus sp. TaxID=1271 RepID=UPI002A91990F|nr:hypothetical protein [Micrococcus sp.]MDY6055463.1 hypothetical protein [Micrococcus sp.]